MNQTQIKKRGDQADKFTIDQVDANWQELDNRTKYSDSDYNSIQALAEKLKPVEAILETSTLITKFGCKGDAVQLSDFNVTGNVLNSPTALFTSSDIGKIVSVAGAGVGGNHLVTTISAFIDINNVTLADNATSNVVNQLGSYGTDNLGKLIVAFNYAIDNNVKLFAPKGVYLIGDNDPISGYNEVQLRFTQPYQNLYLEGAGKGITIFRELDGKTERIGRYTKLFYIYLNSFVPIGHISFKNLTLDKNARSLKVLPVTEFEWEQAHCIGVAGHVTNYNTTVESVVYSDLEIYDKIGAGLNWSGYTKVKSVLIENITENTPSYRTTDNNIISLGNWDAATNIPDILTDTTGNSIGEFYTITTQGTQLGVLFEVDDTIRFNGTNWIKVAGGRLTNMNNITIGERGDIEISLFSENIVMNNIYVYFVQIEPVFNYRATKANSRFCKITNSNIYVTQFTESKEADSKYSVLHLINVTSKAFTVRTLTVKVINCDLTVHNLINSRNGLISNSIIRLLYDVNSNSITPVNCSYLSTLDTVYNNFTFDKCSFIIDSDDVAITPTGYAIAPTGHLTDLEQNKITVTGCDFDKRLYGSIFGYSGINLLAENNKLAGKTYAIAAGSYSVFLSKIVLKNNDWSNVDVVGGAKVMRIYDSNLLWKLEVHEEVNESEWDMTYSGSSGGLDTLPTKYPTILIDDINNRSQYHIKGTIAEITQPAPGTFSKYICITKGNGMSSVWKGIGLVEA